jgi:hypothetical protein
MRACRRARAWLNRLPGDLFVLLLVRSTSGDYKGAAANMTEQTALRATSNVQYIQVFTTRV